MLKSHELTAAHRRICSIYKCKEWSINSWNILFWNINKEAVSQWWSGVVSWSEGQGFNPSSWSHMQKCSWAIHWTFDWSAVFLTDHHGGHKSVFSLVQVQSLDPTAKTWIIGKWFLKKGTSKMKTQIWQPYTTIHRWLSHAPSTHSNKQQTFSDRSYGRCYNQRHFAEGHWWFLKEEWYHLEGSKLHIDELIILLLKRSIKSFSYSQSLQVPVQTW